MLHIAVDRLIDLEADAVNGAVIPHEDGYLMIAGDSRTRRDSYLYRLDHLFHPVGERILLDHGAEDHRIALFDGKYHVWANYGDGTRMLHGVLEPDREVLELSGFETRGLTPTREKNWCPFVTDGRLRLVYRLFPKLIVLEVLDGDHVQIHEQRSPQLYSWALQHLDLETLTHFGGGSNLVEYRGHLVGTFHAKYPGLRYRHFLYALSPRNQIVGIAEINYPGKLFSSKRLDDLTERMQADTDEVEFVAAGYRLRLDRVAFSTSLFLEGDRFYLSVGVNDLITKLALIDTHQVNQLIPSKERFRSRLRKARLRVRRYRWPVRR